MSDQDEYLKLDNQVCFALYSASNAMSRAYQPLLKALDLTYLQYIVMMVLWEQQEINVKALGAKTHLDSGTLTPLLKRLEAKGYVLRKRSAEDERVRVITLTPVGTELKERAQTVPEEIFCLSKMNENELTSLKAQCEQLLDNLTQ
ncbi:Organic hydroperoxide resistance transcriptional regulator [Vibrio chagasii]|uniref:MarR family winged helix-turn-helix transcriptional regulator n=1 Tax=Vibrio TaxID=662 RepID=UPI000AE00294|nr:MULTISPECIES: MarR family transcriptional regulator [Vibrio]MCG9562333.1 MarR family transcriptional regulator [Vibrio chagasii]MCG9567189.1 MarR family transcriptional regulator [Vibrio chagasii]MDA0150683.1 MarR family transcriptional regulator [Vibrio sp. Makdt]CAH6816866.1 Organic hydroperoxide resistance transcriptional regulator [Vibrio chagasii]CAH6816952.1 Organic hydroperoxide resistance transcriptional regulator [Vibrio chagasii]